QIANQVMPGAEASPFYKPFASFAAPMPETDRARLAAAAKAAIEGGVVPAYEQFHRFFVDEYLPACFDEVGAWQLPCGEEFYAFEARRYTTTAMTPAEIHATRLR